MAIPSLSSVREHPDALDPPGNIGRKARLRRVSVLRWPAKGSGHQPQRAACNCPTQTGQVAGDPFQGPEMTSGEDLSCTVQDGEVLADCPHMPPAQDEPCPTGEGPQSAGRAKAISLMLTIADEGARVGDNPPARSQHHEAGEPVMGRDRQASCTGDEHYAAKQYEGGMVEHHRISRHGVTAKCQRETRPWRLPQILAASFGPEGFSRRAPDGRSRFP